MPDMGPNLAHMRKDEIAEWERMMEQARAEIIRFVPLASNPPTIEFPLTEQDAERLVHIRSGLIELAQDSLYKRNDYSIVDLIDVMADIDDLLHKRTPPLMVIPHE